jgi:hypothetical protein
MRQKFSVPIGVLITTPHIMRPRFTQLRKAASSLKFDPDILQPAWCNNIQPIESSQKYHETRPMRSKITERLDPLFVIIHVPRLQHSAQSY